MILTNTVIKGTAICSKCLLGGSYRAGLPTYSQAYAGTTYLHAVPKSH